jgi:hypothetical protein
MPSAVPSAETATGRRVTASSGGWAAVRRVATTGASEAEVLPASKVVPEASTATLALIAPVGTPNAVLAEARRRALLPSAVSEPPVIVSHAGVSGRARQSTRTSAAEPWTWSAPA